ncbi:MAG: hypothetical protein L0G99_14925, partial [Propionibacteriales bacterium]|nr:hypothetical protein [Propionibacteriales bacterium]
MTDPQQPPQRGGSYRHTPPWERREPNPQTGSPLAGSPQTGSSSAGGPTDGSAGTTDAFGGYASPTAFPSYTPPGTNPYATDEPEPPVAVAGDEEGSFACPHCGDAVEAWEGFCESCGQVMTPQAPMPKAVAAPRSPDQDGSVATRVAGRRGPAVKRHP